MIFAYDMVTRECPINSPERTQTPSEVHLQDADSDDGSGSGAWRLNLRGPRPSDAADTAGHRGFGPPRFSRSA